MRKNLVNIIVIILGLSLLNACQFGGVRKPSSSEMEASEEVVDLPNLPLEEAFPYVLEPNSTLFSTLRSLDVSPLDIQNIVDAAKPVRDLARLHAGIRFQILKNIPGSNEITGMQIRFSAIERLDVIKTNDKWSANKVVEPVELKTVTFSGTVTSTLWESAIKANMDPDLISELADIFGWEVDFAREVRINDRWRITVEQKIARGEPIGWGAILAAEYENAGTPYHAILFRQNGEEMGYYNPEGKSLRKMFLKSPIRYGRITSRFSRRRFHPILQRYRAHQGVDYGAPIGTPVRAVGDGTVIFAQRSGGGGNIIKVRHNSTYQTAYKHLHGFAKGVRSGKKVHQGQVIGYVGNTGMSTGPHLHFEFYQSGNYIDPLSKKFPNADPVPQSQMVAFQKTAQELLATLPAWDSLKVSELERAPAQTDKVL